MPLHVIDASAVRRLLPMAECIPVVRAAMMRLSAGETIQPLRQVVPLAGTRVLGVMPGAMGPAGVFGAKVLGVDPANRAQGRQSHQGGILLFDPATSEAIALVHAGEVTGIRTAAASAVATDALARPDASTLAILGYGEQAHAHAHAMGHVRPIRDVRVWGRDRAQADAFAERLRGEGMTVRACYDVATCIAGADVICATTAAHDPILHGDAIAAGTHINLVGSSLLGPREADDALVVRSRFFGDYRPGVLAQGAEFHHAREGGLIDDRHFLGEIGEVLSGTVPGRQSPDDLTIYKSLGHIVQDLASAEYLYHAAVREGMAPVSF